MQSAWIHNGVAPFGEHCWKITDFSAVLLSYLLMIFTLSAWQWWTPPASALCPFHFQFSLLALVSLVLQSSLFSLSLSVTLRSIFLFTQIYSLIENSWMLTLLFVLSLNLIKERKLRSTRCELYFQYWRKDLYLSLNGSSIHFLLLTPQIKLSDRPLVTL